MTGPLPLASFSNKCCCKFDWPALLCRARMRARDMAGADGFVSQIYAERTDDRSWRRPEVGIQSTPSHRLPQARAIWRPTTRSLSDHQVLVNSYCKRHHPRSTCLFIRHRLVVLLYSNAAASAHGFMMQSTSRSCICDLPCTCLADLLASMVDFNYCLYCLYFRRYAVRRDTCRLRWRHFICTVA